MKYIVKWINTRTGYTGRGSELDKKMADAAAQWANEQYPDIQHWADPVGGFWEQSASVYHAVAFGLIVVAFLAVYLIVR